MEFDKIKSLVNNASNLNCSDSFFERLKETSLLEFRKNILIVQQIRPSYDLEIKVLKYYDSLLQEFHDESDLFYIYDKIIDWIQNREINCLESYKKFDYFIDKKMLLQLQDYCHYSERLELATNFLKCATNLKISEIVVDGLFGDTIYNVWINIKEMLQYHEKLDDKDKILSVEKIQFYKMVLGIDNMECKDKINLYHKLKAKNIGLMFYEDLRQVKDFSYQMINKSLINININHHNYDDSNRYGVPVFDLNGDKFFMLIRCMNPISFQANYIRNCYSLISSYNMEVFNKRNFIYGYNGLPADLVIHIFENDSYSSRGTNSLDYAYTGVVNRIMYVNQIVNLDGWSEIQIKNVKDSETNLYKVLSPDFLVVFDKIENTHINESKRLGIPIVRIYTDKYTQHNQNESDNIFQPDICCYEKIYDNYTDGCYMEEKRKVRRILKKVY